MAVRIIIFEILSISSLATIVILYIFASKNSDDALRRHYLLNKSIIMKSLIFSTVMLFVSLKANAGFWTERNIFGYWKTEEVSGSDWDIPSYIWFKEDGTCIYKDTRGTIDCCGYIISDDGATLHLFSRNDFNGWAQFTMVNLSLEGGTDDNGRVFLSISPFGAYPRKSNKYAKMKLKTDLSDIPTTKKVHSGDYRRYDMKGISTDSPKGVYIQSGKKKLGY